MYARAQTGRVMDCNIFEPRWNMQHVVSVMVWCSVWYDSVVQHVVSVIVWCSMWCDSVVQHVV